MVTSLQASFSSFALILFVCLGPYSLYGVLTVHQVQADLFFKNNHHIFTQDEAREEFRYCSHVTAYSRWLAWAILVWWVVTAFMGRCLGKSSFGSVATERRKRLPKLSPRSRTILDPNVVDV